MAARMSLLLVPVSLVSFFAALATALIRDPSSCDCFTTSGSDVFTRYAKFDFRSLGEYAHTPPLLHDLKAASAAPVTSSYFRSDEWTRSWSTMDWAREATKETMLMANTRNNVYIARNSAEEGPDTFLVLRTARHKDFQSVAEIDSVRQDYQHASVRMYARTVGSPGACTALFTYLGVDPVQEADVEFLTRGPRTTVHYTNQPTYSSRTENPDPRATRNVTLAQPMGRWAEHRIDWTEGLTRWFVDGNRTAEISYQAPVDPTQLILNSWSDGGEWTGLMPLGGKAFLQIQWIEVAFNTSSGLVRGQKVCENTCNLDGGKRVWERPATP